MKAPTNVYVQVKWVDLAVPFFFAPFIGGLDETWHMRLVVQVCLESALWFLAHSKHRQAH